MEYLILALIMVAGWTAFHDWHNGRASLVEALITAVLAVFLLAPLALGMPKG